MRLTLVLKLASLLQGFSGISTPLARFLEALINRGLYPCVPAQGSVGASGDLAPLAHLSLAVLAQGQIRRRGEILSAAEALAQEGLTPPALGPKEGLALLNGTQVSTALALAGLFELETVYAGAVVAGMLSTDALQGSDAPFDPRIHHVRGHDGQARVAQVYRALLQGSEIRESHRTCTRVQDPYSLRCQPQVMGACLDLMTQQAATLVIEANAVTDNPLVFPDTGEVLSGGNFHAEPVAFAADILALACAEIGSITERRVALLVDPKMSGLPPFLAPESGVNSGFMMAQVTAAALVAENRMLCHPASVDSIPTSANQEDHVSMATHGARRLLTMTANALNIVAIEFLAACQGIDLRAPLKTSKALQGPLRRAAAAGAVCGQRPVAGARHRGGRAWCCGARTCSPSPWVCCQVPGERRRGARSRKARSRESRSGRSPRALLLLMWTSAPRCRGRAAADLTYRDPRCPCLGAGPQGVTPRRTARPWGFPPRRPRAAVRA